MIPVNSIETPQRFLQVAAGWHSGQGCMLYAVSSSGGLFTGTDAPVGCNSDQEWYITLWRDLSVDVGRARRSASEAYEDLVADTYDGEFAMDVDCLGEYEDWVDKVCSDLEASYGLSDWEI